MPEVTPQCLIYKTRDEIPSLPVSWGTLCTTVLRGLSLHQAFWLLRSRNSCLEASLTTWFPGAGSPLLPPNLVCFATGATACPLEHDQGTRVTFVFICASLETAMNPTLCREVMPRENPEPGSPPVPTCARGSSYFPRSFLSSKSRI